MKLSVVFSVQPAKFAAATFKGDLAANLADISSLGYDGVELAIREPRLLNVKELAQLVCSQRLAVPAIGTGQAWGEEALSFTDPDAAIRRRAIDRIESHVPLGAELGALIILGLVRGTLQRDVEPAQANEWLLEALSECAQFAQANGVRMALEPINRYETTFINSVQQGLDVVSTVGASNFGLLLDTFHMNIEEPDIMASIGACATHIFHFHVADSNRWYPGAGHLDFSRILAALTATGYTGWVSGEFLAQPDALTAAKRSIECLQRCEQV